MGSGAVVAQGRMGEVPVVERWVVVVWGVTEKGASASMWRDCHNALWLSVLSEKVVELKSK